MEQETDFSPFVVKTVERKYYLTLLAHKTEWVNRTKNVRFYPSSCTGKERDEETGYGYFGARYMDHELMTMWLSVDPMADKYPSISPYAYCAWNPVKLVDPDGMIWKDIDGNVITDHSKIKVYIFYDPKSFESQSFQMYNDAIEKYGEGCIFLKKVDKISTIMNMGS